MYNLSFYSVGVIGSIRVDVTASVDIGAGCVLWFVRHFVAIVMVLGDRVIDETYVSRKYMYRLSTDVRAMIVASVTMLNIIILFRMSHFGMNPVSGGSPLSDRMVRVKIDASCGDRVHMVPMSFTVEDDVECSMRKIGVVDMM